MIIITTENKSYKWNYKQMLKNILYLAIAIFIVGSYLLLAKMDFETLIGVVK